MDRKSLPPLVSPLALVPISPLALVPISPLALVPISPLALVPIRRLPWIRETRHRLRLFPRS